MPYYRISLYSRYEPDRFINSPMTYLQTKQQSAGWLLRTNTVALVASFGNVLKLSMVIIGKLSSWFNFFILYIKMKIDNNFILAG